VVQDDEQVLTDLLEQFAGLLILPDDHVASVLQHGVDDETNLLKLQEDAMLFK
jgi:hypothetical protein